MKKKSVSKVDEEIDEDFENEFVCEEEIDDDLYIFRCEYCNKEHSSYCKTARFCSKKCNKAAYWDRRLGVKKEEK